MTNLQDILSRYWGYDAFRPLQSEAIDCVMQNRDSVVVLPTGGGKSLCYQVPAVALFGMAVVVSPLIALMKDQVDALSEIGVPAAFMNSSQSSAERYDVIKRMRENGLKLLYVAPERLVLDGFLELLKQVPVSFFAIDEAHCISVWGHDFRPEYRELSLLKRHFPDKAVHAYTATATAQVRTDIAAQLKLENPELLVGSFDRPNLIYTVKPKLEQMPQLRAIIDRHPGESGIIYCIRRKEVDALAKTLHDEGLRALLYHAGLPDEERKRNQEAFINDEADVIVCTVAFGMGIDKPDVRFVIHWGLPKSLEHYQQESGRAGRDGLPSECCLFYSAADMIAWKNLQSDLEPEQQRAAQLKLDAMYGYAAGLACRHRTLVRHFGQDLESDNCGACDVCLDELDLYEDALTAAQKILSCVVRLGENFGMTYTVRVLWGSREKRIVDNRHDQLSTYGILSDCNRQSIRDWIEQLIAQGFLTLYGEYLVLQVTASGRRLLKGLETPRLLKPRERSGRPAKTDTLTAQSWDGVDRALFERLRLLRRVIASERGLPAFMIFDDAALRDMARRRPATPADFLKVRGVGEKKAADYGERFLEAIRGQAQTA